MATDGQTANYGWVLPAVGGSAATWGTKLNTDLGLIDGQVFANQTAIAAITAQYGASTIILNMPNVAATAHIQSEVAGIARWQVYLGDGEAETGGNAGSNILIQAYGDSGAYLSTPLEIVRNTGQVIANGGLVANSTLSVSGGATVTGALNVSGTTTTGALNVSGTTNAGNLGVTGNLVVTGTTTTGGLSVTGPSGLSVASPGITYGGTSGHSIAFGWDGNYLDAYVDIGLIGGVAYGISATGFTQFTSWGFHSATMQVQANYPGSDVTWSVNYSDRRLKSNIRDATIDALGLLAKLKVHSASLKNPFHDGPAEDWDCALIADEVQQLIPQAYVPPLENGYASIRELPLIATLIKAVQQLTEQVESLNARVAVMEKP